MKNNIEVKQVGNFVISHLNKKEVAISWKGIISSIATQMLTNEKVGIVLKRTGTCYDLPFEGYVYPGIVFRVPAFMSRNKLEKLLMNMQ